MPKKKIKKKVKAKKIFSKAKKRAVSKVKKFNGRRPSNKGKESKVLKLIKLAKMRKK